MNPANRKFRVAFPVITLPEHLGGKRAIVLYTSQYPGDVSGVVFATCVDIDGAGYPKVPIRLDTIKASLIRPAYFQEVDPTDAPLIVLPPVAS